MTDPIIGNNHLGLLSFLWALVGGIVVLIGHMISIAFKSGKYMKENELVSDKVQNLENVLWDPNKNLLLVRRVDCEISQNACSADVGSVILSVKRELNQKIDNVERSLKSEISHVKESIDSMKDAQLKQSDVFNTYAKETSEVLGGLKEAVKIIHDWKRNGGNHS